MFVRGRVVGARGGGGDYKSRLDCVSAGSCVGWKRCEYKLYFSVLSM